MQFDDVDPYLMGTFPASTPLEEAWADAYVKDPNYFDALKYYITWQATSLHMTPTEDQIKDAALKVTTAAPEIQQQFTTGGKTGDAMTDSQSLNQKAINTWVFGDKENIGFLDYQPAREAYDKDKATEARQLAIEHRQAVAEAKAEQREQEQLARQRKQDFRDEHAGTIALLNKYFGKTVYSDQQVLDVANHGGIQQQEDYVRSMNSHLNMGGRFIPIGQYYDVRQTADKVSQTVYGMLSNDTIVADLFAQNATSEKQIGGYYDQLPFRPGKGHEIDVNFYNQVYRDVAPIHWAIWNDEPHPAHLKAVADQYQASQPQQVVDVA